MNESERLWAECKVKSEALWEEYRQKEKELQDLCPHQKLRQMHMMDYHKKRIGCGYINCIRCSKYIDGFDYREGTFHEVPPKEVIERVVEQGEYVPND